MMDWGRLALLLQLGTTLPLVGLTWLIQIVSYPLFAQVGAAEFGAYHAAHTRRITPVVAPLMVGELVGALGGVFFFWPGAPRGAAVLGAGLAILVWLLTAFVSVPRHEVLARGFQRRAHEVLVATHWLRTITWTVRGGLLLWAVARA